MKFYMDKFKEIRPIVLGLVRNGNKLLVSKGYDKLKEQEFYRCLGGGIEFLEKSEDALKREFKEELNIDIKVGKFLGISENIFNYKGKNAHELVLFYDAYIDDKDYQEKYPFVKILRSSHPSNNYQACTKSICDGEVPAFKDTDFRPFKECNEFLEANNADIINWQTV